MLFQIAPNLSNPVNNFADCVEDAVEFVRSAAVWRHEVDRIAERPDQQPATKEITVEARPDTGQIAIVIRGDIKCGDGSDLTDVAKARSSRKRSRPWVCAWTMAAMRSITGSFCQISRLAQAAAQAIGFAV